MTSGLRLDWLPVPNAVEELMRYDGPALARLEAEIAMNSLLQRLPHMQLAVPVDALDWPVGSHLRSLRSLPLTL